MGTEEYLFGLSEPARPREARAEFGVGLGDAGRVVMARRAAVGTAFTYQGTLTELGEPVDGTADFELTLWDAAMAGGQIGIVVSVSEVEVEAGAFTLLVDFGVDPYTTNEARWMEVDVRSPAGEGQFETLSPRQELTPTPVSLATRGINASADGEVGIGTTNPTGPLHVVQNGGGNTAIFTQDDTNSPFATVFADHKGRGQAILATNRATGVAGEFRTSGTNESASIRGLNQGWSSAGLFETVNAANSGYTVDVRTNGNISSKAIVAQHTGQGDCGFFQILNAENQGEAVEARTRGTGDAVQAWNSGRGRAGYFAIDNESNDSPALYGSTVGTGVSLQVATGGDASPEGGGYLLIGRESATNIVMDNRVGGSSDARWIAVAKEA